MMRFFDYTANTIAGPGFARFSPPHFIWLLFGGAIVTAACAFYSKQSVTRRRGLALVTASLALAIELTRTGLLLSRGLYDEGRLPLHLCTMSVYLCFIHALRPDAGLGQFLYAFSLPGAAFALLFPDWADYPAWHFVTLSSFMLHFLLVLYPLMQALAGDIRPDIRRLPCCLGLMLCLALPIYVLNKLLDTNYMFLNWPPAGSPLELFAALGRPGYLLAYLPLGLGAWAILYMKDVTTALKRIFFRKNQGKPGTSRRRRRL